MSRLPAALLALLFAVTACAAEAIDPVSEDADLKAATTLTEKQDGQTVSYVAGQSVIIALASNPTTGYDWAVTSTDKSFGYPTSKYVASSSSKVGSGGTTKLTWATKSPIGSLVGKHTVELAYQRSWEKKPTQVLHFTIEVLPAGAQKPVLLKDADDKKAVTAKAGQDVVVALAANPTAGYHWSVKSTDKTFGYPQEVFESSGTGAVGAGGTQVFTWKTQGALPMTGKHTVTLWYARPGDKTPLKTFTFTVTVQ